MDWLAIKNQQLLSRLSSKNTKALTRKYMDAHLLVGGPIHDRHVTKNSYGIIHPPPIEIGRVHVSLYQGLRERLHHAWGEAIAILSRESPLSPSS